MRWWVGLVADDRFEDVLEAAERVAVARRRLVAEDGRGALKAGHLVRARVRVRVKG